MLKLDPTRIWQNYLGLRLAMADESATIRWIVRDKLHRHNRARVVAPAGFQIDESERQTLIATAGHALHRRLEKRFVDTLLVIGRGGESKFQMHIGCDVPHPVASSIDCITDPVITPVQDLASLSQSGYLCHVSGRDVLLHRIDVTPAVGGNESPRLKWVMHLLNTRAKMTTATLRFCRGVSSAVDVENDREIPIGESIKIPLESHGSRRIRIEFE